MAKTETAYTGYIQESVDLKRSELKRLEANPATVSRMDIEILKANLTYHENVLNALAEGKLIAWHTLGITPEISEAMGIQPMHVGDFCKSMPGVRPEGITEAIDLIDNMWMPPTSCAFVKATVGAALGGQFPAPDFILTASHPCDNCIAGFEIIQELFTVPIFHFETPLWHDERTLDYLGAETKRMVSFLEEQTGQKLDIDRLREIAEESNKAQELCLEVHELRRMLPCPQPGRYLSVASVIRRFMQGLPTATNLFREMLADATERVRKGEGAVPKENARVIWYDIGATFGDFFGWMETEWGAVVPMDLTSYQPVSHIDTSSYDSMMKGIGHRIFVSDAMVRTFHGLAADFIDEFVRIYEDFKGDCAIFPGHNGDKGRWAIAGILRDVCRERKIPLLVMDYDSFDPRVVSAEPIRDKISQFFTTVVLP